MATLSIDVIRDWCDRNGIRYRHQESPPLLGLALPHDSRMMLRAIERPGRGLLTFGAVVPVPVPAERFAAVARAASRANAFLFMGAWVLNEDRSELYFRVTFPTEDVDYDDDAIRAILEAAVGTVQGTSAMLEEVVTGADPTTVHPVHGGAVTH